MGGRFYPQKNNGKDKELLVKKAIVRGRSVDARIKME